MSYRHDYERWSRSNLINEILRLESKVETLLQEREGVRTVAEKVGRDCWHEMMSARRDLPSEPRTYAPEELEPVDLGGGITVLVPPTAKSKEK